MCIHYHVLDLLDKPCFVRARPLHRDAKGGAIEREQVDDSAGGSDVTVAWEGVGGGRRRVLVAITLALQPAL
jgi:hypothetical protein